LAAYKSSAQPSLIPLLAKLLADGSPDVRKKSLDACRRFARHSGPFARSAGPTAALLKLITAIVNRDTPNHVLRYEADRALAYWLAVKKSNSTAGGNPGGAIAPSILSALDNETANFLADYGRRGLRRAADEDPSDDEDADA
jgi:hypothetical protein